MTTEYRDLYALDPGEHSSALAHFRDDHLINVGMFDRPIFRPDHKWSCDPEWLPVGRALLVVEGQIIARHTRKPNDILRLAFSAGGWYAVGKAAGLDVEHHLPVVWKGSLDKPEVWRRSLPDLDEAEQVVLNWRRNKDTKDAVSIGLWRLGRVRHR